MVVANKMETKSRIKSANARKADAWGVVRYFKMDSHILKS